MLKPKWSYGQVYCALSKQYGGHAPRNIVRSFAAELFFTARVAGPPFSPYAYARSLGIQIEHDDIQAEALFMGGNKERATIILPIDDRILSKREHRRRNFTVAHELGHYMIKRALAGAIALNQLRKDDPEEELLCDAFASELLMPRQTLLDDIRKSGTSPQDMMDLADRYDVSLQTLLSKAVEVCKGFFAAVIWTKAENRISADWTSPYRFREAILCDTGQTSVERAFCEGATLTANDSLIVDGRLTKWCSTSMRLPESRKVLTAMTRVSKPAVEYLGKENFAIDRHDHANADASNLMPKLPIQRMLPFEELSAGEPRTKKMLPKGQKLAALP